MNTANFDKRSIRNPIVNGHQSAIVRSLVMNNSIDLKFIPPNFIALYLSVAKKNKTFAINKWELLNIKDLKNEQIIEDNKQKDLYDILEHIFIYTVFSCQAIEAFSNQLIPDDFQDSYGNNKRHIEERTELKIKFKELIPRIYEIESPSNQPFWSKICELIKYRNEIVHLKSAKDIFVDNHYQIVIKSINHLNNSNFIQNVNELMNFFLDRLNKHPKFNAHYIIPKEFKNVDDWELEIESPVP